MKSQNKGRVVNSLPVDRLVQRLNNEMDFWRSYGENLETETDEVGQANIKWTTNNEATTFGQQLEAYLNEDGYSLNVMEGLQSAVKEAEAAEGHQKMVQHRGEWQQNSKVFKIQNIIDTIHRPWVTILLGTR